MARNANGLTEIQQKVLDFMREFHAENDQLPPMKTMSEHFGWRSGNAAHEHACALEIHGMIEKNTVGKYRFARDKAAQRTEAVLAGWPGR